MTSLYKQNGRKVATIEANGNVYKILQHEPLFELGGYVYSIRAYVGGIKVGPSFEVEYDDYINFKESQGENLLETQIKNIIEAIKRNFDGMYSINQK